MESKEKYDLQMTADDFAMSFGTTKDTFSNRLKLKIDSFNFNFRIPTAEEYDSLLREVLLKIESDGQKIGAAERTKVWFDGWNENLQMFRESNFDEAALRPKFIRKGNPVRLKKRFVFPEDDDFELNYIEIFRDWYIETYFCDLTEVHEFGCGTGFNLLAINKLFPNITLRGSDFVQSSVDLVNEIAQSKSINLKGEIFDMLDPNYDYHIKEGAGIYTFGSLEQLASNLDPVIEFFLTKKPSVCIHSEPAIEFYENDSVVDILGRYFQGQRGYSSGLAGKLKKLEQEKKIEILKMKRLYFGSFFMEGYNLFVWRPVK